MKRNQHLLRINSDPLIRQRMIASQKQVGKSRRNKLAPVILALRKNKQWGIKLIGREVGLHHSQVSRILRENGVVFDYIPKGKGYHRSKQRRQDIRQRMLLRHILRMRNRVRNCLNKKPARVAWKSFADRYHNDIEFRIKCCLRRRIRKLIETGKRPTNATLVLLGCSLRVFRLHIEKQFALGMCWDNYGEWELDHIRSCSTFDLLDKNDQLLCFNYSNYQPLWKRDNRIKSGVKRRHD